MFAPRCQGIPFIVNYYLCNNIFKRIQRKKIYKEIEYRIRISKYISFHLNVQFNRLIKKDFRMITFVDNRCSLFFLRRTF
jgi:hypothetical protein